MKEIKDNTNKWEKIPCSWIGRTHIVKMSILPRQIYTFKVFPIKIPLALFTVLKQTILKRMEPQKTLKSQSNFEKEKES